MKESNRSSDTPAKRLLAKLKSPLLCLASELNPSTPHTPVSCEMKLGKRDDGHDARGRLVPFHSGHGQKSWLKSAFDRYRLRPITETGSLPSRWYQQRREAVKEIREISDGRLELSPFQLYYKGHDRSHQVICTSCQVSFRLAVTELCIEGPDVCPVCFGGLLSRLGSPERINNFIFHISGGQVLFIKNQLLGCTNTDHRFYHLGCKQTFLASFDHVVSQNQEGKGCGCTNCE